MGCVSAMKLPMNWADTSRLQAVIEGEVTPERKGVVRLQVHGPGGLPEEVTAVIDTGFTGSVALPTDTITRLGLPLIGSRRGRLADGSLIPMYLYLATVLWDGLLRRVQVLETGGPCLVGVSLLYGYVLTFEAIEGGHVSIEKLPYTHCKMGINT